MNQESDPDKPPRPAESAQSAKTGEASGTRKRRGRRRQSRPEIDYSVPSPCIAICEYDENGLCKGCQRNADEIRDWIILSRDEKLAVLERIAERRNANRD